MAPYIDPQFTFGVELEFIAELEYPFGEWPSAQLEGAQLEMPEEEAVERVRDSLKSAGIPVAFSMSELFAYRYAQFSVETDESLLPVKLFSPPNQRFGIELVSPKLDFEDASFETIGRALSAVAQVGKLYTSDSAAFHVHLGRRDGGLLPFQTVKRLAMVLVAHEEIIESMLNSKVTTRRYFSSYCMPTRQNPFLRPYKPVDRALLIHRAAKSFKGLVRLLNPALVGAGYKGESDPERRLWAYNYIGLDQDISLPGKVVKRTLEIRHHPSSLDTTEIKAWVKFHGKLLQWCHEADEEAVLGLVEMGSSNETDRSVTLDDFLRHIGLETGIVEYYLSKTFSREQNQPGESSESDYSEPSVITVPIQDTG